MRIHIMLLFVIMMAGCTTNVQDDSLQSDPYHTSEGESTAPESKSAQSPISLEPLPPANRTFLGYAASPSGPTAFELRIDAGSGNRCSFSNELSGRHSGSGPNTIKMVEHSDGGYSWGSHSYRPSAFVQAGQKQIAVDEVEDGEYWSWGSSWGSAQGVVTFTVLGEELGLVRHRNAPTFPLRIEVECSKPFEVLSARQGGELHLFDRTNLHGSYGASVPSVGATWNGEATQEVEAPKARIVAALAGDEFGNVEVRAVDKSASLFLERGLVSRSSGPGNYGVSVSEIGVNVNLFWTAIFGFDSDVNLSTGLYDEPVMESRI